MKSEAVIFLNFLNQDEEFFLKVFEMILFICDMIAIFVTDVLFETTFLLLIKPNW